MDTMPVLMEIELLHEHHGAPAGKLVVKYVAESGGTLVCSHKQFRNLSLPEGTYRLLRAWHEPQTVSGRRGGVDDAD